MTSPTEAKDLEDHIMELLHRRGPGKSICPSEVARTIAGGEHAPRSVWEPLMESIRASGRRLAAEGDLFITQRGAPVDPSYAKGPIRFQLREQTTGFRQTEAASVELSPSKIAMPTSTRTSAKTTAKKSSVKKSASKTQTSSTGKSQNCWPGYEHVQGKKPGTKGSCKPVPGEHSPATRRATQRSAAASKLEKQGKPNPHRS